MDCFRSGRGAPCQGSSTLAVCSTRGNPLLRSANPTCRPAQRTQPVQHTVRGKLLAAELCRVCCVWPLAASSDWIRKKKAGRKSRLQRPGDRLFFATIVTYTSETCTRVSVKRGYGCVTGSDTHRCRAQEYGVTCMYMHMYNMHMYMHMYMCMYVLHVCCA